MMQLRVVCYTNQFFGGLGGEEHANTPVQVQDGAVGTSRAIQPHLGDEATIVATIIGGDNYMVEQVDQARDSIVSALRSLEPQVVIAGPAFDAGRYGAACALFARAATEELGIPAVLAMHPENPGVLLFREGYVVPTGSGPAELGTIAPTIARLALMLGHGEEVGPAADEGYLPRGIRQPGRREKTGRERALEMLKAKLTGQPYQTEMQVIAYGASTPAPPVCTLSDATLALITTGGIVPKGNPDRLVRGGAKEWFHYSIDGLAALDSTDWDCIHRGFHIEIVKENPNYVLPLHIARELEAAGVFKSLYPWFFSTSGVGTAVTDAKRMGEEMGHELAQEHVNAALLVAT